MLYKVFLVEDEVMTREGIRDSIAWADTGYEFCGEAPDGEIALPLIREQQPEVVITDIQMPFMDGLELSRILHETMPNTKIIILSGHDEFKYAQQAIQSGVTEYLLKPLSSQDLRAALRKVGRQLDLEHQASNQLAALQTRVSDQQTLLYERSILNVLAGSHSATAGEQPTLNTAALEQLLKSGVKADIARSLDSLFEPLNEISLGRASVERVLIGVLMRVANTLRDLDIPPEPLVPELRSAALPEHATTLEQIRPILRAVLERVIDHRDRQTNHQQMLIDQARAYIEANYANPDMSLNMVATAIMLSPSYFSMVFGREVGETFTGFLTKVRVRHAIELLRTTALTSSEIAMRVGYQNPRYFHAVFRKATGQSPIEFRRRV